MQDSISLAGAAALRDREAATLDALAERSAQGDQGAFEQLYLALVEDVYAYVRPNCAEPGTAEDIVANVFLRAWRSSGSYRCGSLQFRHWLFGITRNEVRAHWKQYHPSLPILDRDFRDDGYEGSAERARAVVAAALARLTEEQRQVVVLRYFESRSHEEIAAMLGKREGAVRAQLMRAMRRLREVLGDGPP